MLRRLDTRDKAALLIGPFFDILLCGPAFELIWTGTALSLIVFVVVMMVPPSAWWIIYWVWLRGVFARESSYRDSYNDTLDQPPYDGDYF